MLSHIDDIRASLRKHAPYLQDGVHAEIAQGLVKDGLARGGDGGEIAEVHAAKNKGLVQHGRLLPRLTAREAATASFENERIVKQLSARARRLGYEMPMDKQLSLVEIDRAFADQDITERLSWKMTAGMIGLL